MPISVDELATQLLLIGANWRDYRDAVEQDQERRQSRAGAHDVSVEVFQVFMPSLHPPGLKWPLQNRQSGRRKKRQKPVRRRPLWKIR